jgi:hypothetical protein
MPTTPPHTRSQDGAHLPHIPLVVHRHPDGAPLQLNTEPLRIAVNVRPRSE